MTEAEARVWIALLGAAPPWELVDLMPPRQFPDDPGELPEWEKVNKTWQVWAEVLDDARCGGHPSGRQLGELVRRYGVPDEAKEYVAARLSGELHLRDGGAPATPATRAAMASQHSQLMSLYAEILRRRGERGVRAKARQIVAARFGVTADTLRRSIRRNLTNAPAHHIEWLAMFAADLPRLSPERFSDLLELCGVDAHGLEADRNL